MRAGQLRHYITIQRDTGATSDSYKQHVESWTTLAQVHVGIFPLSGREAEIAKQTQADLTHKIIMRHTDINPKDRIRWGSRTFNVVSVLNTEERGRELSIMANERL